MRLIQFWNSYCNSITASGLNIICSNGRHSQISTGCGHRLVNSANSHIAGGVYNCIINSSNTFITGIQATSLSGCSNHTRVSNLAKASGSFAINHPDPSKKNKELWHSFVESPTAGDNIYRFTIRTTNCEAILKLPDYYKYLNNDTQVFISPKDNFGVANGIIDAAEENINIKSNEDGLFNVLVIGTRKDKDAASVWKGVERYKEY